MIVSMLLGAGLMPKWSIIIPSHSTTEKQNSDFGRFTDNLLCHKQSKVSRSSSSCSPYVRVGMMMSSSQFRTPFFLTLMMLPPTQLAKTDGTVLRPKPQRTYSHRFPYASRNAVVRYLSASRIVSSKNPEATSKQQKYADRSILS